MMLASLSSPMLIGSPSLPPDDDDGERPVDPSDPKEGLARPVLLGTAKLIKRMEVLMRDEGREVR